MQNTLNYDSQKPDFERDCSERYRNPHLRQNVLDQFDRMRSENVFFDVILVADGVQIPAHRILLAACSPYFYAMFTNFKEKTMDRIEIKEVESTILESLINYVYSSELLVTEENVQFLIPAANLLQFSAVTDFCCEFLNHRLHLGNCISIFKFADLNGCFNLLKTVSTYIITHFSEVMQDEEFLSLPASQIIEIIEKDELAVDNEDQILEFVLNWVRKDPENRQNDLLLLMKHVRLPLISREYLGKKTEDQSVLLSNCLEYVNEALAFYYSMEPSKRTCVQTMHTRLRKYQNKVILLMGCPKTTVECYYPKEKKWYAIHDMPSKRLGAGAAVLGNKVYIVGGLDATCNYNQRLKTVDEYNIQTNDWSIGVPMNSPRSSMGVAVLHDKLYAVGGNDGFMALNTAEVFDPIEQKWKQIARMLTRRTCVGVAALNNRLYAVGGCVKRRTYLDTVEYYSPETDTWHEVSKMLHPRRSASVGILDGILYAIGGFNDATAVNIVEAYDPRIDAWKNVAKMTFCRENAGVVTYNGLLYVMGGISGSLNRPDVKTSVEVYCAQSNTWKILPERTIVGHTCPCAVLIDKPSILRNN